MARGAEAGNRGGSVCAWHIGIGRGTRYWVNATMVFSWRKRDRAAFANAAPPQLVAVLVTPEQISAAPAATPPAEDIEIELPHGTRIRVGAGANAAALRVVQDALARRCCVPGECAGVARGRAHRYAARHEWTGFAGATIPRR